jgi:signal transduction histidine kinase
LSLYTLYALQAEDGPLKGILRIRTFIVAYASPILGIAGFGIVWLYTQQGAVTLDNGLTAAIVASFMLLIAPALAIITGSLFFVGLMLFLSVWLSLTIGAIETSGIYSGQIPLLVQLPIWATFFFGRKGALTVMGLVQASLVLMLLIGPTSIIQGETSQRALILADGLMAMLAASIVLVIVYIQEYLLSNAESQKKEIEKSSAAKSEFLSSMSHELRTPMNSILGFSQLLVSDREAPLTQDQKQSAEQIIKSGRHLLGLIDQVLDLAQIESGKAVLNMETVWPADEFRVCMEMVRPLSEQKGVSLEGRKESIRLIRADPAKLRQVIVNLLSNAIKYNREDGNVLFGCVDEDDDFVKLFVSDTGSGIPQDMQDQLFEPFNRLGHEASGIEGTGVGLTITRQLVEAMGGHMGFESQAGEGSTFWARFPAEVGSSVPQDTVDS